MGLMAGRHYKSAIRLLISVEPGTQFAHRARIKPSRLKVLLRSHSQPARY